MTIQASRLFLAFALSLSAASPAVAASFDVPNSASDASGLPAFADWMLENIWGSASASLISTTQPDSLVQTVSTVGVVKDPPPLNAASVTIDPIGSPVVAADPVGAPEPASVLLLCAGAAALYLRRRT